jgi:hypothetical protein
MNLAVVSCFYHFAPFERPVANMHRFIRRMEDFGVPVFGVEAFLPGKPKHTADYANWTQIEVCPETQVLWQKEALLNLAEKLVREGLARIHTTGAALPDGRSARQFEAGLRELERQARAAGRGGWRTGCSRPW